MAQKTIQQVVDDKFQAAAAIKKNAADLLDLDTKYEVDLSKLDEEYTEDKVDLQTDTEKQQRLEASRTATIGKEIRTRGGAVSGLVDEDGDRVVAVQDGSKDGFHFETEIPADTLIEVEDDEEATDSDEDVPTDDDTDDETGDETLAGPPPIRPMPA